MQLTALRILNLRQFCCGLTLGLVLWTLRVLEILRHLEMQKGVYIPIKISAPFMPTFLLLLGSAIACFHSFELTRELGLFHMPSLCATDLNRSLRELVCDARTLLNLNSVTQKD